MSAEYENYTQYNRTEFINEHEIPRVQIPRRSATAQRDMEGGNVVALAVLTFILQPTLVWSSEGTGSEITIKCLTDTFIAEGEDLMCECKTDLKNGVITWPGYSNTSQLEQKSRMRQHNGTTYTCRMDLDGAIFEKHFTLQVAYGPVNQTMHIDGPSSFDGKNYITLTCVANEVNPEPIINWPFGPCNHGKEGPTCTFLPDPVKHDKLEVVCRAFNPRLHHSTIGYASFVLHYKYPPPEAPEIIGHEEGQIHQSGDKLTCVVRGGKPLVSSVNFSCTNPAHADEQDVFELDAVSSSLTLNVTELQWSEVMCSCYASWDPQPTEYVHVTSVSFAVWPSNQSIGAQETADFEGDQSGWKISTIVLIILILIILIGVTIGIFVLWKCGVISQIIFKWRTKTKGAKAVGAENGILIGVNNSNGVADTSSHVDTEVQDDLPSAGEETGLIPSSGTGMGIETESEDGIIDDSEQSLLTGEVDNHSAQGPDHQSTNVLADGGPSQTSVSVDNSKIDTSFARENGNDHSESEENGEIGVRLLDNETLSRGTDGSEHDGAGEGGLVMEENPGRNNSGDVTTSFGHMEGTDDRSRDYLSACGSKGTTASAGSLEAASDRIHGRGHARMPSKVVYSVQSQSGTGSSEM